MPTDLPFSFTCQISISGLAALQAAGISSFRLSPQRCDMVAVARFYRDVLDGKLEPEAALAGIRRLYPEVPMANGLLHGLFGAELVLAQPP